MAALTRGSHIASGKDASSDVSSSTDARSVRGSRRSRSMTDCLPPIPGSGDAPDTKKGRDQTVTPQNHTPPRGPSTPDRPGLFESIIMYKNDIDSDSAPANSNKRLTRKSVTAPTQGISPLNSKPGSDATSRIKNISALQNTKSSLTKVPCQNQQREMDMLKDDHSAGGDKPSKERAEKVEKNSQSEQLVVRIRRMKEDEILRHTSPVPSPSASPPAGLRHDSRDSNEDSSDCILSDVTCTNNNVTTSVIDSKSKMLSDSISDLPPSVDCQPTTVIDIAELSPALRRRQGCRRAGARSRSNRSRSAVIHATVIRNTDKVGGTSDSTDKLSALPCANEETLEHQRISTKRRVSDSSEQLESDNKPVMSGAPKHPDTDSKLSTFEEPSSASIASTVDKSQAPTDKTQEIESRISLETSEKEECSPVINSNNSEKDVTSSVKVSPAIGGCSRSGRQIKVSPLALQAGLFDASGLSFNKRGRGGASPRGGERSPRGRARKQIEMDFGSSPPHSMLSDKEDHSPSGDRPQSSKTANRKARRGTKARCSDNSEREPVASGDESRLTSVSESCDSQDEAVSDCDKQGDQHPITAHDATVTDLSGSTDHEAVKDTTEMRVDETVQDDATSDICDKKGVCVDNSKSETDGIDMSQASAAEESQDMQGSLAVPCYEDISSDEQEHHVSSPFMLTSRSTYQEEKTITSVLSSSDDDSFHGFPESEIPQTPKLGILDSSNEDKLDRDCLGSGVDHDEEAAVDGAGLMKTVVAKRPVKAESAEASLTASSDVKSVLAEASKGSVTSKSDKSSVQAGDSEDSVTKTADKQSISAGEGKKSAMAEDRKELILSEFDLPVAEPEPEVPVSCFKVVDNPALSGLIAKISGRINDKAVEEGDEPEDDGDEVRSASPENSDDKNDSDSSESKSDLESDSSDESSDEEDEDDDDSDDDDDVADSEPLSPTNDNDSLSSGEILVYKKTDSEHPSCISILSDKGELSHSPEVAEDHVEKVDSGRETHVKQECSGKDEDEGDMAKSDALPDTVCHITDEPETAEQREKPESPKPDEVDASGSGTQDVSDAESCHSDEVEPVHPLASLSLSYKPLDKTRLLEDLKKKSRPVRSDSYSSTVALTHLLNTKRHWRTVEEQDGTPQVLGSASCSTDKHLAASSSRGQTSTEPESKDGGRKASEASDEKLETRTVLCPLTGNFVEEKIIPVTGKSSKSGNAFVSNELEEYLKTNIRVSQSYRDDPLLYKQPSLPDRFMSSCEATHQMEMRPDKDEIDNITFYSFVSRDALMRHIANEKPSTPEELGLISPQGSADAHTMEDENREEHIPDHPVFEKTTDITKIKGWKKKFGDANVHEHEIKTESGELPSSSTMRPTKVHWRTQDRLVKSLSAEQILTLGLLLKKKRRKIPVFTKRKGSTVRTKGRPLIKTEEGQVKYFSAEDPLQRRGKPSNLTSAGKKLGRPYCLINNKVVRERLCTSGRPSWQKARPVTFIPEVISRSMAISACRALQVPDPPPRPPKTEPCDAPGCRYGCVCHLCDPVEAEDDEDTQQEVIEPVLETKCEKEYCRLGCICESIDSKKKETKKALPREREHCGKPECMFGCQCEVLGSVMISPKETSPNMSSIIADQMEQLHSKEDNSDEDYEDDEEKRGRGRPRGRGRGGRSRGRGGARDTSFVLPGVSLKNMDQTAPVRKSSRLKDHVGFGAIDKLNSLVFFDTSAWLSDTSKKKKEKLMQRAAQEAAKDADKDKASSNRDVKSPPDGSIVPKLEPKDDVMVEQLSGDDSMQTDPIKSESFSGKVQDVGIKRVKPRSESQLLYRESDYSKFHGTDYAKVAKMERRLEAKKRAKMRREMGDAADRLEAPEELLRCKEHDGQVKAKVVRLLHQGDAEFAGDEEEHMEDSEVEEEHAILSEDEDEDMLTCARAGIYIPLLRRSNSKRSHPARSGFVAGLGTERLRALGQHVPEENSTPEYKMAANGEDSVPDAIAVSGTVTPQDENTPLNEDVMITTPVKDEVKVKDELAEDDELRKRKKKKKRKAELKDDKLGVKKRSSFSEENNESSPKTDMKFSLPGFRTQMVLLQRKALKTKLTSEDDDKEFPHLLEIQTNCNWDAIRSSFLSKVSGMIETVDYPPVVTFAMKGFNVAILPKPERPTNLPPNLQMALQRKEMMAIRVMISDLDTDLATLLSLKTEPESESGVSPLAKSHASDCDTPEPSADGAGPENSMSVSAMGLSPSAKCTKPNASPIAREFNKPSGPTAPSGNVNNFSWRSLPGHRLSNDGSDEPISSGLPTKAGIKLSLGHNIGQLSQIVAGAAEPPQIVASGSEPPVQAPDETPLLEGATAKSDKQTNSPKAKPLRPPLPPPRSPPDGQQMRFIPLKPLASPGQNVPMSSVPIPPIIQGAMPGVQQMSLPVVQTPGSMPSAQPVSMITSVSTMSLPNGAPVICKKCMSDFANCKCSPKCNPASNVANAIKIPLMALQPGKVLPITGTSLINVGQPGSGAGNLSSTLTFNLKNPTLLKSPAQIVSIGCGSTTGTTVTASESVTSLSCVAQPPVQQHPQQQQLHSLKQLAPSFPRAPHFVRGQKFNLGQIASFSGAEKQIGATLGTGLPLRVAPPGTMLPGPVVGHIISNTGIRLPVHIQAITKPNVRPPVPPGINTTSGSSNGKMDHSLTKGAMTSLTTMTALSPSSSSSNGVLTTSSVASPAVTSTAVSVSLPGGGMLPTPGTCIPVNTAASSLMSTGTSPTPTGSMTVAVTATTPTQMSTGGPSTLLNSVGSVTTTVTTTPTVPIPASRITPATTVGTLTPAGGLGLSAPPISVTPAAASAASTDKTSTTAVTTSGVKYDTPPPVGSSPAPVSTTSQLVSPGITTSPVTGMESDSVKKTVTAAAASATAASENITAPVTEPPLMTTSVCQPGMDKSVDVQAKAVTGSPSDSTSWHPADCPQPDGNSPSDKPTSDRFAVTASIDKPPKSSSSKACVSAPVQGESSTAESAPSGSQDRSAAEGQCSKPPDKVRELQKLLEGDIPQLQKSSSPGIHGCSDSCASTTCQNSAVPSAGSSTDTSTSAASKWRSTFTECHSSAALQSARLAFSSTLSTMLTNAASGSTTKHENGGARPRSRASSIHDESSRASYDRSRCPSDDDAGIQGDISAAASFNNSPVGQSPCDSQFFYDSSSAEMTSQNGDAAKEGQHQDLSDDEEIDVEDFDVDVVDPPQEDDGRISAATQLKRSMNLPDQLKIALAPMKPRRKQLHKERKLHSKSEFREELLVVEPVKHEMLYDDDDYAPSRDERGRELHTSRDARTSAIHRNVERVRRVELRERFRELCGVVLPGEAQEKLSKQYILETAKVQIQKLEAHENLLILQKRELVDHAEKLVIKIKEIRAELRKRKYPEVTTANSAGRNATGPLSERGARRGVATRGGMMRGAKQRGGARTRGGVFTRGGLTRGAISISISHDDQVSLSIHDTFSESQGANQPGSSKPGEKATVSSRATASPATALPASKLLAMQNKLGSRSSSPVNTTQKGDTGTPDSGRSVDSSGVKQPSSRHASVSTKCVQISDSDGHSDSERSNSSWAKVGPPSAEAVHLVESDGEVTPYTALTAGDSLDGGGLGLKITSTVSLAGLTDEQGLSVDDEACVYLNSSGEEVTQNLSSSVKSAPSAVLPQTLESDCIIVEPDTALQDTLVRTPVPKTTANLGIVSKGDDLSVKTATEQVESGLHAAVAGHRKVSVGESVDSAQPPEEGTTLKNRHLDQTVTLDKSATSHISTNSCPTPSSDTSCQSQVTQVQPVRKDALPASANVESKDSAIVTDDVTLAEDSSALFDQIDSDALPYFSMDDLIDASHPSQKEAKRKISCEEEKQSDCQSPCKKSKLEVL